MEYVPKALVYQRPEPLTDDDHVIILGSGNKWDDCDYKYETWIVAKMLMMQECRGTEPPKRVDKLYSMDDIDYLLTVRHGSFTKQEFINRINESGKEYISCRKHPDIPLSKEYDLGKAINTLPIPYFSNTICYMIADAIFAGKKSIHLWGVSQGEKIEYITERGGVEFWLGYAIGKGIDVTIHTPNSLLGDRKFVYGYAEPLVTLQEQGRLGNR